MKKFRLFIIIAIVTIFAKLDAQQIIELNNPSFEDMPRRGMESSPPIKGWHDCGKARFPGESPPDIHPLPYKAWEVTMLPIDGKTYLGMVVRHNDSYEFLSQELNNSILSIGKCYKLSAYLSRSPLYKSPTSRNSEISNFTNPVVFKIWGGDQICKKWELLAESIPIENSEWLLFEFIFSPQDANYSHITIEAAHVRPILEAYNGHVLVDGLSSIVEVECK